MDAKNEFQPNASQEREEQENGISAKEMGLNGMSKKAPLGGLPRGRSNIIINGRQ